MLPQNIQVQCVYPCYHQNLSAGSSWSYDLLKLKVYECTKLTWAEHSHTLKVHECIKLTWAEHNHTSSSSFSSTTLCECWLAQLFLSIAFSPASFVSNYSRPSSSNHSSHCLPILILAFPLVLLHTVSICIWSWPLFHLSFFLHVPTSSIVCILCILLYFCY